MSHPWFPQPYYGTRQARLTAPVPQPMGLGGLGGKNEYYTAGIFDEHVAMPDYMREPTGVHGFGALGQAPACYPPGEVANELFDVASTLAKNVPLKKVVFGQTIDLGTLGSIIDGLRSTLVPMLASELQKGAREWARGRDAIIHWLAQNIAKAAGLEDIAPLIESGLKSVASTHLDKFIGINICYGESREMSEVFLAQPQPTVDVSSFLKAYKAYEAQPTPIQMMMRMTPEQRAMMLRAKEIAEAEKRKAGGQTAMLVGAAALAALLLLR